MIIELDNAFEGVDFSNDQVSRDAIDTISLSVFRGEHFLLASRSVLEKLSLTPELSSRSRGVCATVKANYTFIKGVLQDLRYRVRVIPQTGQPVRTGPYSWNLPVTHVAGKGIRPSVLLGENSHDADVYTKAAQHYRIESGKQITRIRVESRNGNGAFVSQELQRIANAASEFCLCITDSDKFCPGCAAGTIHAACQRVVRSSNWVVQHFAGQQRELENVLPSKLTETVMGEIAEDTWSHYTQRINLLGEDAKGYCDLKESTTLKWIFGLPVSSPAKIYWTEKFDKLRYVHGLEFCDTETICNETKCRCIVVPALVKDIATHARRHLDETGIHETHRLVKNSPDIDEWLRIGQEVFEIGVAPEPHKYI